MPAKNPNPSLAIPPYVLWMILLITVLMAYSNVYDNAFLFDDDLLISNNVLLDGWGWAHLGRLLTASTTEGAHIAGGFYRPVQIFLYFIINHIAGRSIFAFHLLNITIHAANVCLVFALGQKLRFNKGAAFFAALMWAVHPLHIEAITYISATADTLWLFFILLGCVVVLPDASPRRVWLALPVFALGLLSKEATVVFPALAVLCLFAVNPSSDDKHRLEWRRYIRTWPFWIMAFVYMAWRLNDDTFDGPKRYEHLYQLKDYANLKLYADHFTYRLYTFFATLPAYAELLVWPADLHMERAFPIYASINAAEVYVGLCMVVAATTQIIMCRGRKFVAFSWGLLWFGAAHFPDCGLVVPTNSLFLEHWMYLPSVGLFLGGAETIAIYLDRFKNVYGKKIIATLCLVTTLVFGIVTYQQNAVWHDPFSFYGHLFDMHVISARAHNNLALAYALKNDNLNAIKEFQKAMDITDTYAETRHNYAIALMRLPDPESHEADVIANLKRALEIDPHFYRSMETLAYIYRKNGQTDIADDYQQRAAIAKQGINQK